MPSHLVTCQFLSVASQTFHIVIFWKIKLCFSRFWFFIMFSTEWTAVGSELQYNYMNGACHPSVIGGTGILLPSQCHNLGKIFTYLTYKLLLRLMVISAVYRSIIPNQTSFTKHCLTQWISKLPWSFEIHWVGQYLVNFMSPVGIVNATVYKMEPIFASLRHGKLS